MLQFAQISYVHWTAFIGAVLVLLALDLGVFHRRARVIHFREAFAWTCLWFTLAMCFCIGLRILPAYGAEQSNLFLTGYLIELSLSMDNVFVIALIFNYFGVPPIYQHRVLFWGILGALVMRLVMILLGVALIERFDWLLFVLGVFLIYSGVRMIFTDDTEVHPEKNPVVKLARRFFPVSSDFDGQKFTTIVSGKRILTPMALVLLMVETTDLVFALDSIPAIFGVTKDPFIIFTSNVFAILGLRSLYFVLAGAISYFCYLKVGLSAVLIFIGFKMVLADWFHVPTEVSLFVVVIIIGGSIIASFIAARRRKPQSPAPEPPEEETLD